MSNGEREKMKQLLKNVLEALSEDERKLFSAVVQIEAGQLHLERPRVKDELLSAVKRIIP